MFTHSLSGLAKTNPVFCATQVVFPKGARSTNSRSENTFVKSSAQKTHWGQAMRTADPTRHLSVWIVPKILQMLGWSSSCPNSIQSVKQTKDKVCYWAVAWIWAHVSTKQHEATHIDSQYADLFWEAQCQDPPCCRGEGGGWPPIPFI